MNWSSTKKLDRWKWSNDCIRSTVYRRECCCHYFSNFMKSVSSHVFCKMRHLTMPGVKIYLYTRTVICATGPCKEFKIKLWKTQIFTRRNFVIILIRFFSRKYRKKMIPLHKIKIENVYFEHKNRCFPPSSRKMYHFCTFSKNLYIRIWFFSCD